MHRFVAGDRQREIAFEVVQHGCEIRTAGVQRIEAVELRRIFRRTLRAMPRRTRRVFLMHRLRGMTYRQISERLGIGEKGVEYHMMRALARCRRAAAIHFLGQPSE